MSFNVIVTTGFKKHAKSIGKKHHSLKSDIKALIGSLEQNPLQGEPLGKDCYKVHMAITSKDKGKSGGYCVITCVKVVDQYVYLLTIYDKSIKENIFDKELDNDLMNFQILSLLNINVELSIENAPKIPYPPSIFENTSNGCS